MLAVLRTLERLARGGFPHRTASVGQHLHGLVGKQGGERGVGMKSPIAILPRQGAHHGIGMNAVAKASGAVCVCQSGAPMVMSGEKGLECFNDNRTSEVY
jgi:hypothetical protein